MISKKLHHSLGYLNGLALGFREAQRIVHNNTKQNTTRREVQHVLDLLDKEARAIEDAHTSRKHELQWIYNDTDLEETSADFLFERIEQHYGQGTTVTFHTDGSGYITTDFCEVINFASLDDLVQLVLGEDATAHEEEERGDYRNYK